MALDYFRRKDEDRGWEFYMEPRLDPELRAAQSEVFDSGAKTIVDCAHVRVERLDTHPVLFSKVFKEFKDRSGQKYDYRYWAERENFILREFLKKQGEFTHVVQARHLISENDAAKQVLTCDAGITIANWLRVQSRYADSATLAHPFQRWDAFLHLLRACLVALKQIHGHRIVHCDIKEDNICIPYAPQPFPGPGQDIRIEFGKLKIIDFAFSLAHAIPLTQILVINPEEPLASQSERLVGALRADRSSGYPNAVAQLDYRVDLFSLGYMAGKISAAGLHCPPEPGRDRVLREIADLVEKLKAFDSAPDIDPLPHDGVIAAIDHLLAEFAGLAGPLEFKVQGEWSADDMARGLGADRKTPMTPVALPLPTPIALPIASAEHRPGALASVRRPLLMALALVIAASAAVLAYRTAVNAPALSRVMATRQEMPRAQAQPDPAADAVNRIRSQFSSDDDAAFQTALEDLTKLSTSTQPGDMLVATAIAGAIDAEYGAALAAAETKANRSRALGRLMALAKAGNPSSARRVAAFENDYDEVKRTLARSSWWLGGQGAPPAQALGWMENGALLADHGDRPAMLDSAFAMGHGRALAQDRAGSVEMYLKVIAHATGSDATSARIRGSALRGLAAMLNAIAAQKDQDAATRILPVLESMAGSGAADLQYFLGLMNECVRQPADLDAARHWYRLAAADPSRKLSAGQKARTVGMDCPRRTD
ncbi:MAG: hypothetical protein ABIN37_11165 [Burkholderiaceae bacterium]